MDFQQQCEKTYGLPPYFDDRPLDNDEQFNPEQGAEYVLWIDLMGMQNMMHTSLPRTANFVTKLVRAAQESVENRPEMKVRPVIDGAFIHGPDLMQFLLASHDLFARLALVCLRTENRIDWFIVRGGMAHGVVVRGERIPIDCFYAETYEGKPERPAEVDKIIFGPAVSSAYAAAENAPPFGVTVAPSASEILSEQGGHPGTQQWRWWLRAYPKSPAARKEIQAQAKCSIAR